MIAARKAVVSQKENILCRLPLEIFGMVRIAFLHMYSRQHTYETNKSREFFKSRSL